MVLQVTKQKEHNNADITNSVIIFRVKLQICAVQPDPRYSNVFVESFHVQRPLI